MDSELRIRIDRIYAAVGGVTDKDVDKYPPKVIQTEDYHGVYQDFSGGATKAELSNTLHTLVHNVANLNDHLRKWATQNGIDKNSVRAFLQQSDAFCIVCDLSNNDKHGYPPRDGGLSGNAPKLGEVKSSLRMTSSGAMMIIGPNGEVQHSGSQERIISGPVTDKDGQRLGDANDLLTRAVQRCEEALAHFGLTG